MRRAAPGAQVSAGRLRVDAARAIAKLREYQLADRAAWILEAIRAAVASDATQISLRGDANDIWLAWHGPAWDPELLPRLFDELVSPEPAEELQHVRLLAAAVNSALGMNPSFVDVYAIEAAGRAKRVRSTPDVLAEPANDLGDAPLRHVEIVACEPPEGAAPGMFVHLHRRVSFAVIGYLFRDAPELRIARDHCRDITVPMTVGDDVLGRKVTSDVVQVPLGDGLDGFLAITAPERARMECMLEVAERGVLLARYPLDLFDFEPRVPIPVRVHVNADRLPTNASRSQVRQDIHPISTAKRRCRDLLAPLVAQLVADVKADKPVARHAALLLLAANVGGHVSGWSSVAAPLHPLAKLPLVRSAVGKLRSLTVHWRSEIHDGRAPLDADLEPWLGDVAWLPERDPARALLAGLPVDRDAMRQSARHARQQRRARRKFLSHSQRELRVQTEVPGRVRVPLGVAVDDSCVPDIVFTDKRGEVCVYPRGKDASLVLLLQGRQLERVELESPIPFDAVIEYDRLEPADRYRGARRDSAFSSVLAAMHGGVVRAIEALVVRSDAAEIDDSSDRELDLALVQQALTVAKSQGFVLDRSPLVGAPAWRSVTGETLSLADLRACGAVGYLAPTATLVPPKGRVVVLATGARVDSLHKLIPGPLVSYQHAAGTVRRVTPAQLATSLARPPGVACVHVRDGELVGVIALSSLSRLQLHHMGTRLWGGNYVHTYLRCAIAVDSDRLVPDDSWSALRDDAGMRERAFVDWEHQLLRAIARRLLGDHVPELEGPEAVALEDENGLALAKVLIVHDANLVLGAELHARLLAHPMLPLLGSPRLYSVDEVAEHFAGAIPYLTAGTEPIAGYTPLVASETVARMVAALTKRSLLDGRLELERRRKKATYEASYAALLAKPVEAIHLIGDLVIAQVTGRVVAGELGVRPGPFEIRFFVERRLFAVVHPKGDYPLVAAVAIAASECDDTLARVTERAVALAIEEVLATVPALLDAVLARDPTLLDSSPLRALLGAWLPAARLDDAVRERLCNAPAWRSIQGGRVSLTDVAMPRQFRQYATWSEPWLPPGDGEPASSYDEPILYIASPSDELLSIAARLAPHASGDVTVDVARLQARRRMARGLLPKPKVIGLIPPALKRELETLGNATVKLGHGEIGLVETGRAVLAIHDKGVLARSVELDVIPAVHLAVEDPHDQFNFEAIRSIAQGLALELVGSVIEAGTELPQAIRRQLARGLLGRRIPPSLVARVPLFVRTDGTWLDGAAFNAAVDALDESDALWAVTSTAGPIEPLDPARVVIVLAAGDIELAAQNGFRIIDAAPELELDAKARTNQARPRADSLDLPWRTGVLAEQALDGDGKHEPRGTVAILEPSLAHHRGIEVYRDMQPLGRIDDVCRWPTIAVVDDARITPDRTWSAPRQNETWHAIAKRIRSASEAALATLGEAPGDALSELRITNHACAEVIELKSAPGSLIRGLLWLTGLPYTPVDITVHHRLGTLTLPSPEGLAIGGELWIHNPDPLRVKEAVSQLCQRAHGKLVRALVKKRAEHDDDLVAAHVAHAIARRTVQPTEVSMVEFPCFSPKPLSARALATLARDTEPVLLAREVSDDPMICFVDDGSELARVLRTHFGERLVSASRRMRAVPSIPPPTPANPPVSVQRPAPPVVQPPKRPHVLAPLVSALSARVAALGIGTHRWLISDASEPLATYADGTVVIAGANSTLARVAAELAAKTILAGPAIDVIAAHVVTVLNLARTDVTDASEAHAIGVLLASPPSAARPRSRRSS